MQTIVLVHISKVLYGLFTQGGGDVNMHERGNFFTRSTKYTVPYMLYGAFTVLKWTFIYLHFETPWF